MIYTCLHWYRLNILFVCVLLAQCVLHFYLDAVNCLTVASFIFAYLYYQGLKYTKKVDKCIWLMI